MAAARRKATFTVDSCQLEQIRELVERGRYRTSSEFIREAIDEKLERMRRNLLAEQVASYCEYGHAGEGDDLIKIQAFDREE